MGSAVSAAEQNPGGDLGPADPPQRRGLTTLERKEKVKAEKGLADMKSKDQV